MLAPSQNEDYVRATFEELFSYLRQSGKSSLWVRWCSKFSFEFCLVFFTLQHWVVAMLTFSIQVITLLFSVPCGRE
jgi:hypothetical protein